MPAAGPADAVAPSLALLAVGGWGLQAAVILLCSLAIGLLLPEFWLHPYGPMAKNLPMLAVLVLLWQLEPRGDHR